MTWNLVKSQCQEIAQQNSIFIYFLWFFTPDLWHRCSSSVGLMVGIGYNGKYFRAAPLLLVAGSGQNPLKEIRLSPSLQVVSRTEQQVSSLPSACCGDETRTRVPGSLCSHADTSAKSFLMQMINNELTIFCTKNTLLKIFGISTKPKFNGCQSNELLEHSRKDHFDKTE